jgi:hypothetical protein
MWTPGKPTDNSCNGLPILLNGSENRRRAYGSCQCFRDANRFCGQGGRAEPILCGFASSRLWHAATLRSTRPHARLLKVSWPALPPGYVVVDRRDVTGTNRIPWCSRISLFCRGRGAVCGGTHSAAGRPGSRCPPELLLQTRVLYRDLPALLTLDEAMEANNPGWPDQPEQPAGCFVAYNMEKGIRTGICKGMNPIGGRFHDRMAGTGLSGAPVDAW